MSRVQRRVDRQPVAVRRAVRRRARAGRVDVLPLPAADSADACQCQAEHAGHVASYLTACRARGLSEATVTRAYGWALAKLPTGTLTAAALDSALAALTLTLAPESRRDVWRAWRRTASPPSR